MILDPTATVRTPRELWTSTGLRAIDHCVEAYLSHSPTPVTDAAALHGLELLFKHLETSANPDEISSRLQCQLAGWLSMLGVNNVVLGLSHGIGHQLGGHCNVPHGITSCIMLPPVMDLVRSRRPESHERLRRLSAAIGHNGTGKEEEPTAASAAEWIRQLVNRLGLPSKLSQVGVRREQFPELANASMKDLVVASAPIKVDAQDIMQLLETAY